MVHVLETAGSLGTPVDRASSTHQRFRCIATPFDLHLERAWPTEPVLEFATRVETDGNSMTWQPGKNRRDDIASPVPDFMPSSALTPLFYP